MGVSGPGVGPFSNNQFVPAPRAVISPQPPFRAEVRASTTCSVDVDLSSLDLIAATSAVRVAVSVDLSTLAGSGGNKSYLRQLGPGIGPASRFQFQSAPRSTNPPFQTISLAVVSGGSVATSIALATGILFALDIPGGDLSTEGGDTLTTEGGLGIAIEPARGTVAVTVALTTGIRFAASLDTRSAAAVGLQTSIVMAAAAYAVVQASPTATMGISLSVKSDGLLSTELTLGSSAGLAVSANALADCTVALQTGITLSASASSTASADLHLAASGAIMAVQGGSVVTATLTLAAANLLIVRADGSTSVSVALQTGVSLAVNASGVTSATPNLTAATQMATTASAQASSALDLQTVVAPFATAALGRCSVSADFAANSALSAVLRRRLSVTVDLLTVMQPPGTFADVIWLRAPRALPAGCTRAMPYGEFYQRIGERLWYAIVWEDWLSNRWEPNAAAVLGQTIRPTVPTGYELVCTKAGQTGAVESTWPSYVGAVTMDGSALWAVQAMSADSLEDTIEGTTWSAPTGITLDSGQFVGQRTFVLIDTTAAAVGTDYDVLNTIVTPGGQQKIGKLRIKVR